MCGGVVGCVVDWLRVGLAELRSGLLLEWFRMCAEGAAEQEQQRSGKQRSCKMNRTFGYRTYIFIQSEIGNLF